MDELKIIAEVKEVGTVQRPDDEKDFKYCDVEVMRSMGSYEQTIALQFINQKCELASTLVKGKTYEFTFDIKCRKHEKGFYTNIVCYKVAKQ